MVVVSETNASICIPNIRLKHLFSQGLLPHQFARRHSGHNAANSHVHVVRCAGEGQTLSALVLRWFPTNIPVAHRCCRFATIRRQRSAVALLQNRLPQGLLLSTTKRCEVISNGIPFVCKMMIND